MRTKIKKHARYLVLIFCLSLASTAFALEEVPLPATFSDTIPQSYRWLSSKSVRIPSSAQHTLWIEGPTGFKVMAVNDSTGVYAGVVAYNNRGEDAFNFTAGTWTIVVDSADRAGTFRCGVY